MVWNTIAHPKMVSSDGLGDNTPITLQHVSAGKQNVYDLIVNNRKEGVTIVYGDYDDLCAKLVRGELVLGIWVTTKKPGMQVYMSCRRIGMMPNRTIHGKPIISVEFDEGTFVIDCNNAIYDANDAPLDPVEPSGNSDVA